MKHYAGFKRNELFCIDFGYTNFIDLGNSYRTTYQKQIKKLFVNKNETIQSFKQRVIKELNNLNNNLSFGYFNSRKFNSEIQSAFNQKFYLILNLNFTSSFKTLQIKNKL